MSYFPAVLGRSAIFCLIALLTVSVANPSASLAQETADLSLSIDVATTKVSVGDTIRITIRVHNAGPDEAEDVRVDAKSKGLQLLRGDEDEGDVKVNRQSVKWDDMEIDEDEYATLVITAVVLQLPAAIAAEVKKSDARDPDSRPGKGTAEDDNDTVVFSDAGTSGGSDGGLESNGSLSQKLAQVLYQRRLADAALADAGVAKRPALFQRPEIVQGAFKSGNLLPDLRSFIPETGPQSLPAREVSPADLLPVTNAIDLAAVDYVQPDGRRSGVVFAAATESGEVYEHTKAVCDRLRGAKLEAIDIIQLNGTDFVVSQLMQEDGTVDYALSFVVYERGDSLEIDSRFLLGDYDPPNTAAPVYNYQVWSETEEDMRLIAGQMLDELAQVAPLSFATASRAIAIPDVYVRTGYYREGELVLEVVNRAGATQLSLDSGTKAVVEGGERTAFAETALLSEQSEDDPYESEVRIALGPVFDADFAVTSDSSDAPDLLYLADGSWSWAVDQDAAVDEFAIRPARLSELGDVGTFAVERGGHLSGEIAEWATLFRYLRPSGAPVDLTGYAYLEFVASGEAPIRVQVEKASRVGRSQYGKVIALTPEPRTYRVWFDELTTSNGVGGFTPDDVVLLSFNTANLPSPDGVAVAMAPFRMDVEAVRFRGAETDLASSRPSGPVLYQSYPNPADVETRIRFDLPEPGVVRVGVFDVLGRAVARISDGWHASGPHSMTLDTSGLATGMYFVWLESDAGFQTRGLVVR